MMNKYKTVMLTSALPFCITASTVEAQVNDEPGMMLEEVIVTARKRAESLQDVPLALTALSSADIQDAGIDNVKDIAQLTPGFTFASLVGNESSTPVIRGMSTTIGEPNVGFFIDGVYQSSRNIMDSMLGDTIDRVEIVKGPQSALFGRNTFAGAINFVTKKPSDEFTGQLTATTGNGGHHEFRGNVSGPLINERLLAQFGAVSTKTDGFFTNELSGGDLDSKESTIVTGALMFYPNEESEIVARVGFDKTRNGDNPLRFVDNNISAANPTPAPLPLALQGFEGEMPSYDDGFAVSPGFNNHDNFSASLSAEFSFEPFILTAITGYNDLDLESAIDNDYEARSIRYLRQQIDQEEFSQELRFTSNSDGKATWMFGAYYYKLEKESVNDDRFVDEAWGLAAALQGSPLAGLLPPGLVNHSQENTESYAIFGSFGYELTDRLSLTLDGRWTTEDKDVNAMDTNPLTLASGTFAESASFENFVPRFTLDYKLSDSSLIYTSVAKAVKTGGFNVATTTGAILDSERSYSPEESWNYELGMKNTLANGQATLNVAAFYTRWSDQIVRALGQTFAVLNANAGETSIQGLEAELQANLSPGLSVSAGLAYTDSSYDEYSFGALAGLGLNPVLDGTRLQFVSEYQANASVQYLRPMNDTIDWKTRIDVSYQSDQSTVQTATAFIESATLFNVRTGFETDTWEVTIWVENLFEEDSAVGGAFLSNQGSRYDTANSLVNPTIAPLGFQAFNGLAWSRNEREWGVTARAKF